MTATELLADAQRRVAHVQRRVVGVTRVLPPGWWAWGLPLFVYGFVRYGPIDAQQALYATAGIGVMVLASRHPTGAFCLALGFVTLQQVLVPLLWSWGLPAQLARGLSGVRDAMLVGLLLNTYLAIRRRPRAFDVLDRIALAYVGLVLLYLLIPALFRPALPTTWGLRLLAFRFDAGYVLLFFAFRHADLPPNAKRTLRRVIFGLAAVVAAGAVYEHFFLSSWSDFILETARVGHYRLEVLNIQPWLVQHGFSWMLALRRAGSFLMSPHDMAHALVVPFAFAVERMVRGHRRFEVIVAVLIVGAIVFSKTRADSVGMLFILALALIPRRGRTTRSRIGMTVLICAASIIVVPSVVGTRFTGGEGGAESSKDHVEEIRKGIRLMAHFPLGTGLGNGPSTADRYQDVKFGTFTTSDFLTQVGNEFGYLGLAIYIALLIALGTQLVKRGRGDPFASAVGLAFAGLCLAGIYQHVFVTFTGAWALWAAAGLALRDPDR